MAKKIRWVYLLKKLILCVSKPKTEKRSNGCRWIFQRFNLRQLPANSTPERTLLEVSEEQRKHALKVARATAAAAEAAVAAAQAAAEVVRLTGVPESYHQHEKEIQNLAATRIQTAFRAYIARKAFRALKGIVGLQAIVRGRAVRRLVNFKLKHLPSAAAASIQSQIPAREVQNFYDSRNGDGNRSWICRNEMEGAKLECKREQQWNDSMFSEEEVESMSIRKLEAISRRNRMKQYSFSHRERHYGQTLEEALAYRNQWAEENVYRKERLQNTVQIIHSNPRIHDIDANLKLQSNSSPKGKSAEELSSPFSHPRRSISHTGQKSSIDDSLSTSSSSFPSYMAATESAKAKMRSISTPRQRKGSFDTCFRHDPCCQSMRCSWSYFNHVSSSIT